MGYQQDNNKQILTLKNPVFSYYLICVSFLVLKMMALVFVTVFYRMKAKLFISREDAVIFRGEVGTNDNIDRVRRAHLNDLENIPAFLIVAFCYIFTEPSRGLAATLFILFTICRFLHTFVYAIFVVRQPVRAVLFYIAFCITGFMAMWTAIYTWIHLFVDLS